MPCSRPHRRQTTSECAPRKPRDNAHRRSWAATTTVWRNARNRRSPVGLRLLAERRCEQLLRDVQEVTDGPQAANVDVRFFIEFDSKRLLQAEQQCDHAERIEP